jgi:hypothetical protein
MRRCIAAASFYLKRQDYTTPFLILLLLGWCTVTLFHYLDDELYKSTRTIVTSYLYTAALILTVELLLLVAYVVWVCWRCRGYEYLTTPPGHNQPYHEYRVRRWTPKQLFDAQVNNPVPFSEERIVGSAIKALDGTVYSVERPGRHHHCIWFMVQKNLGEHDSRGSTRDQGFMTSRNRYIGRKEARALAIRNGQATVANIVTNNEIHSEDLWETPVRMQHKY